MPGFGPCRKERSLALAEIGERFNTALSLQSTDGCFQSRPEV